VGAENTFALDRGVSAGRVASRRSDTVAYQEAFLQVYQTHYTKVFAYIYSRTNNVELTKDLTAEVFEKAYAKGAGVREPAAYVTWLFMIAKNAVVGYFRKQQRENRGMDRVKEAASLHSGVAMDDPEETALRSEAMGRIMSKLRELSERDQELLALKFDSELSYSEISAVLRMSEVNVRVSIFRALKRLRNLVDRDV
jgi:RNA polymerase sigma factor (sigma-70 family)